MPVSLRISERVYKEFRKITIFLSSIIYTHGHGDHQGLTAFLKDNTLRSGQPRALDVRMSSQWQRDLRTHVVTAKME